VASRGKADGRFFRNEAMFMGQAPDEKLQIWNIPSIRRALAGRLQVAAVPPVAAGEL